MSLRLRTSWSLHSKKQTKTAPSSFIEVVLLMLTFVDEKYESVDAWQVQSFVRVVSVMLAFVNDKCESIGWPYDRFSLFFVLFYCCWHLLMISTSQWVDSLCIRFNQLSQSGVRWVYRGNGNKFSDNIEPEYITFNSDYTTAYIILQVSTYSKRLDVKFFPRSGIFLLESHSFAKCKCRLRWRWVFGNLHVTVSS